MAERILMVDDARETLGAALKWKGESLNTILWARPGTDVTVAKTNFGKLYRPWGMVVVTGVFGDDLAVEMWSTIYQAGAVAVVLILLLGAVTFWIARGISTPLRRLRTSMMELAENRPISGAIDSYYEYLLKCWLLFGDEDCHRMWLDSLASINQYLADETKGRTRHELWYRHADMNTGRRTATTYGALDAFFPAVLAFSILLAALSLFSLTSIRRAL